MRVHHAREETIIAWGPANYRQGKYFRTVLKQDRAVLRSYSAISGNPQGWIYRYFVVVPNSNCSHSPFYRVGSRQTIVPNTSRPSDIHDAFVSNGLNGWSSKALPVAFNSVRRTEIQKNSSAHAGVDKEVGMS